jgi:hypothetical protein
VTRSRPLRAALAASVAVAIFLWWLAGRRYLASNDEGIFLEGALRILRGQAPYRDFFILMGPGAFWLEALALKAFGVSLAASHIVTIADLSVIAGCVCLLLARWTSAGWAVWVALASMLLQIADPAMAQANHRLDSAAFAIAAVTLLTATRKNGFIAGLLAGFAAWITPSVALVAMALLAWLCFAERGRFIPFLSGCVAVSACCAAVLASQRALAPMLDQMLWTGRNYGGANFMPYGSRLGGYAAFFEGASGGDIPSRILVLLALSMPALLPPIVLLLCRAGRARENRELVPVTIGAFALLLAAYPRFDVPHLTYAAPLFYVIAGFHLSRGNAAVRLGVFGLVCVLAAIPAGFGIFLRMHMVPVDSRVGRIVAMPADAEMIRAIERDVPEGARVFCFPYLPMFYFLTLGENPTRFSYLQPGMMEERDEQLALAELRARPPDTILYQNVTPEMILRIWPNSDPRRLRLEKIEAFLRCGYRPISAISYNGVPVRVLRRAPDESIGR